MASNDEVHRYAAWQVGRLLEREGIDLSVRSDAGPAAHDLNGDALLVPGSASREANRTGRAEGGPGALERLLGRFGVTLARVRTP